MTMTIDDDLDLDDDERERRAMLRRRGAGGLMEFRGGQDVPHVHVKSEPLTYSQHDVGRSYFRDLLAARRGDTASRNRLARHRSEMRVIAAEQEQQALRDLRAGGVEYRVEPNSNTSDFVVPLWLNQYFATAKRGTRVLADLMPSFPLAAGVSSVSVPILTNGTTVQPAYDGAASPGSDLTDSDNSGRVVTLTGTADVSLQPLEQSPAAAGASLDFCIFKDLTESLDFDLEQGLLYGTGNSSEQLLGVTQVSGITAVTFTSAGPTGSLMWPYLGQACAQLADARKRPPEAILTRHARWQWISSSEDLQSRPFSLPEFYPGRGPTTPDPIGAINNVPVWTSEAVSATLGAGGNQDQAIALRFSDLLLFQAPPVAHVFTEVLSGSLGARVQLHQRVAALTARYPTAIATVGGTGFTVQSGW